MATKKKTAPAAVHTSEASKEAEVAAKLDAQSAAADKAAAKPPDDGRVPDAPKKKRGRPPGSKSAKKETAGIPGDAEAGKAFFDFLWIMALNVPLAGMTMVSGNDGKDGKKIRAPLYPQKYLTPAVVEEGREALHKWLATVDFELTPGWTVIAMYVGSIGSAAVVAMIARAMEESGQKGDPMEILMKLMSDPAALAKMKAEAEATAKAAEASKPTAAAAAGETVPNVVLTTALGKDTDGAANPDVGRSGPAATA